jgi:hypothetical protein
MGQEASKKGEKAEKETQGNRSINRRRATRQTLRRKHEVSIINSFSITNLQVKAELTDMVFCLS